MSSVPVALPALYLDDTASPTEVGIIVANTIPEEDSIDAAVDTDIQLDVLSTDTAIVNKANTDVYVNGIEAVLSGVLQSGFNGPSAIVEMLALPGAAELLSDGDAEYKGSQLVADGDMEYAGPQLVSDYDMEAGDTSAWTAINNAALTKESGNPSGSGAQVLRVAYNGTSTPQAEQSSITTIGKTYRIRGWGRGDGTYIWTIRDGGVNIHIGTSSTTWEYFDVTYVATATYIRLVSAATAAGWAEFDEIDLSEDCPDWTAGNAALLSKESGSPGGSGSQVLRVTYSGTTNAFTQQAILTVGKSYRFTGWARGNGTVAPRIYLQGAQLVWQGTSSTSWQSFEVSINADYTAVYLMTYGSSGWTEWDDVTVTEDCPDWTQINDALLSKEGSAHGGSYCLRVSGDGTANPGASQSVVTAVHGYRLTGLARSDGTNAPLVLENGTPVWTGTTSTSWQEIDLIFSVTSTTVEFGLAASSGYVEFDDLELIEYHDLRVVLDPTIDFDSEEVVTVRVVSQTVGGTYTVDYSYSFTIEDIIEPQLVSALATAASTIRATFDEGMLASSDSGAYDALNPANYTIAYVPVSDRQAAVSVAVTEVTQVSAAVYDLTTDIELTFWRPYRLTCGDIADDSSNANLLDTDYRTADFDSWTPPGWPDNRRFRLWDMLSNQDRRDDITGDLERLLDVWQDMVWMMLWDADRIEENWDTDKAREVFLDAKLQDLGNPHKLPMTELQKRKLLDFLVESYGLHGNEDAVIYLVRFFLGITVTVYAYNSHDYRWVLGQDLLGKTTILGPPAGTAQLYTFVVQSLTELTEEERRWILRIVEVTKVGHEHVEIKDPTDSPTWDHWQLGKSKLGTETILH